MVDRRRGRTRPRDAGGGAAIRTKAQQFAARSAAALGIGEAELTERLSTPRRAACWFNPRSSARDRARAELAEDLERIPWAPDAWWIPYEAFERVQAVLAANPGALFVQNASSIVVAEQLDVGVGSRVLDVCAAPGGKLAYTAAFHDDALEIWANDASAARLDRLQSVFAELGLHAAQLTNHKAEYIDRYVDTPIDNVLADVQCTGESRMNPARPETLRHWSLERVQQYRYLQQRMLMAAWKVVRPGGQLVYSTCTIAPEENELPIAHLVEHRDDAEIEPISSYGADTRPGLTRWDGKAFPAQLSEALRIVPSADHEAFFVCRLRKRE